jgi:Zn ribbon nucleic-acid-binding protein
MGGSVGTVISIESARRRRDVSRFCTECKKAWSLAAVRRGNSFVVACKNCGHVRATIPVQQRVNAPLDPPGERRRPRS